MRGLIQHVVLFRFPTELTGEEEREALDQIRSWPAEIGGFTKLRFGRDLTGDRSQGYQYLLFTEFESDQALADYLPHPVHQRFSRWVAERGCQTLAFDYRLDEATAIAGD
jgi:hypothetical protein